MKFTITCNVCQSNNVFISSTTDGEVYVECFDCDNYCFSDDE